MFKTIIRNCRALRRNLFSRWVQRFVAPRMPKVSVTERTALEAGTVGWERTIFSGKPDFPALFDFKIKELTKEEQAFLDGPVEELCSMLQDYEITKANDLPEEVWEFMKTNKFFGMIIPKSHGGLGFSAAAHSAVIQKLSSRSVAAAVTVMVPNSLGPAELILHYGTPSQREHYLPRLATGEEIPCFALTSPEAGSDAMATTSMGLVCVENGVFGIRLNCNKRYSTLSSVSTVIGLAFLLEDPNNLLGWGKEDVGMTCALVPSDTPGVEVGPRHDPLGVAFHNGTVIVKDAFIPMTAVIGGQSMCGFGWKMLMEALACGRGVSLPALSAGGSKVATRAASNHATIRKQFGIPIAKFEGVDERLARMAGLTYLIDSSRRLTLGAIDAGERPSVVSAIAKVYSTEGMRQVVNDAMDICGGGAISRGPRNILANLYSALPIGITVEGANILTRTLIIYGQGSLRCHKHLNTLFTSASAPASADNRDSFDRALFGTMWDAARNGARAFVHGLTGGRFGRVGFSGTIGEYAKQLNRLSAAFAVVSDASIGVLQGKLKRKEKISGRLADAFAALYMASATLRRFRDDGCHAADAPLIKWAMEYSFFQCQEALRGVIENFPLIGMPTMLRLITFPLGYRFRPPSDKLGTKVSQLVCVCPEDTRERLTQGIYLPPTSEPGLGQLEDTYNKVIAIAHIAAAAKDPCYKASPEDTELLAAAEKAREEAIQVDAFFSDCSV